MQVDVEKVLADKAPKLAKKLPRFLINCLKKIVHQDEINQIMASYGEMKPYEFIHNALEFMGVSWHIKGMDKLPKDGRYLFASNHPFGGMDGIILASEVIAHLGDVRSISNDILMVLEPLAPILLPINKHGAQSRVAAEIYENTFASDMPIQTFPAGLCSRRIKGEITDLEWKTNFTKKAIQHNRMVVPVHFEGRLSNRFYNIYSFRKFFGIKANIEMLYLVDEMFRQRGKNFEVVIGDPISPEELAAVGSPREQTEYVRAKSYALAPKSNK
ncbi:MAG: acyltransferase [Tidjanibacter sp.]|nr:acyltransferase [Tidjanibacter sp.]